MLRYALTRLISLGLSLVVASLVVFLALEVVPGDPAAYMLGMNARPETVAALRAELGLDAGPVERYAAWVGGLVTGDLGISYAYRTPVSAMVARPAAGVAAARALRPRALHAASPSRSASGRRRGGAAASTQR